MKNVTIKGSSDTGIYREYGNGGTDYTTGFGNVFQGNAQDTNAE